MRIRSLTAIVAALGVGGSAPTASAELLTLLQQPLGVGGTQILTTVDTATGGVVASALVAGVGEDLSDLDRSPVNGQVYGIGRTTGRLYNVNINTGTLTLSATPSAPLGTAYRIDFNPQADRLRVASLGNGNYRLTPGVFDNPGLTAGEVTNDGTYAYAPGDVSFGAAPLIVGLAYTNNVNGVASTTLYSLDATANALVSHTGGPQFGTLQTVAPLTFNSATPIDFGTDVGFDIAPDGTAYVTLGPTIYTLNLQTGALARPGGTAQLAYAGTTTFAVVPEPASLGLLAVGGLTLMRRRRR